MNETSPLQKQDLRNITSLLEAILSDWHRNLPHSWRQYLPEMTPKERVDLIAHRLIALIPDPDAFETEKERDARLEYGKGVVAAIRYVEAVRDDKICPHCGNEQHRDLDGFRGVSLEEFVRLHPGRERMIT